MPSFEFYPRADDLSWNSDGMPALMARNLTADDFTFRYFHADVVISDGADELFLRTPGLPVIDFVLMLVQLQREVASVGETRVETSKSQDSIHAVRRRGKVEVSYGFPDVVSEVSLRDFEEVPRKCLAVSLAMPLFGT
ncbi:hypothetical protein [Streptomyces buecherae]|uniref:Uncharacterized protein n=1 Tax=Streptomyces buecherae TaxID=2763006 RepID=A0A7H8NB10_9ACTN|nr:hypothetical protein [Streptomyces buecherae]QKW51633.1 hypothetical protein HUT08_21290 [Streptomyces buecherae]